MIRLPQVNPSAVQFILASIPKEQGPAYMEHFASCLQRQGQDPNFYYSQALVGPDASVQHIQSVYSQAVDAAGQPDWARMVHPQVLAQAVIDLAERDALPVPDNTYVFDPAANWQLLTMIQPSPRPTNGGIVAPPPAAPVAAPVAQTLQQPAQAAADPYPPPTPISARVTEQQPVIQLQPEPDIIDGQFAPQSTLSPPAHAQQPLQQPASNVVPMVQPTQDQVAAPLLQQPQVQQEVTGTGEYGLPLPTMSASKGASPFLKDPGGDVPKSAPARQLRDIIDMAPHLFASPAGDVVGKGNGVAQRTRVYMAALLLADKILASVPDPNCPVGYLRFHIEHLRYHAGQSAAGGTMLAHEKYLFSGGGDD
jgi:hypothetical protein